MKAFNNDQGVKDALLVQVTASENTGSIKHSEYGNFPYLRDGAGDILEDEDGMYMFDYTKPWNGCAVGVITHTQWHDYATHDNGFAFEGIPEHVLRQLEDIFEGHRLEDGSEFTYPRRFLEAIPVGADLSDFHVQGDQYWCEECQQYHRQGVDTLSFDRYLEQMNEYLDGLAAKVEPDNSEPDQTVTIEE